MVTWLAPEGDTDEQQFPGSRPLLGEAAGRLGRQGWRGFAGWESRLGRLALLAQGFDHTGCFGYRRGWRGSQGVCKERRETDTRRGSASRRHIPRLPIRGSFDEGFLFSFHYFTGKTSTSTKDFSDSSIGGESF